MRQQILDKVEESFKKAEAYYNRTFTRPKNIIFKRNGTVGGHSNYLKSELMFQLDFAEAYPEDFLGDTVPHEVAHYVDREMYGYTHRNGRRIVHGRTWKFIMRNVYKLDPERCHNYDPSVTKTKKHVKYTYQCACGTLEVSKKIHNKIQVLGRTYHCRRCKQNIFLVVKTKEETISELQQKINQLQQQLNYEHA